METSTRGWLALVASLVFVAFALGGRVLLQRRLTGQTGIVLHQAQTRLERVVTALFAATLAGLIAMIVIAIRGGAAGGPRTVGIAAVACATALLGTGLLGTLIAQIAMGRAWRVGVDREIDTELVTSGPFRVVRNPIYTCMTLFVLGLATLVPGALAVATVLTTIVAVELQVRAVEEPFLCARHRDAYGRWARGVGRFVPRVGRLPPV